MNKHRALLIRIAQVLGYTAQESTVTPGTYIALTPAGTTIGYGVSEAAAWDDAIHWLPLWTNDLDDAIALWQEWARVQPITAVTFWQTAIDKTHDQLAWEICERWLAWKEQAYESSPASGN